MKVVALMGSPYLDDHYHITHLYEEILYQYDDIQFEYIFIKDFDFETCQGSFMCVKLGEGICSILNNAEEIVTRICSADGIILASSVYTQGLAGSMKNIKERNNDGPEAIPIITLGGNGICSEDQSIQMLEKESLQFYKAMKIKVQGRNSKYMTKTSHLIYRCIAILFPAFVL